MVYNMLYKKLEEDKTQYKYNSEFVFSVSNSFKWYKVQPWTGLCSIIVDKAKFNGNDQSIFGTTTQTE